MHGSVAQGLNEASQVATAGAPVSLCRRAKVRQSICTTARTGESLALVCTGHVPLGSLQALCTKQECECRVSLWGQTARKPISLLQVCGWVASHFSKASALCIRRWPGSIALPVAGIAVDRLPHRSADRPGWWTSHQLKSRGVSRSQRVLSLTEQVCYFFNL